MISENWISDNHADDHGGGLYIANSGTPQPLVMDSNIIIRNSASGISPYDNTSGGGVWLYNVSGLMEHNTLVDNVGLDPSECFGGVGIAICETSSQLEIASNIISLSQGGALVCENSNPVFGPNLIWGNSPPEQTGCDAVLAEAILSDPLFCNPATDDYRVSSDSPALANGRVLGAYPVPGCGPGVPVKPTTWGQLKARYR